MVVFLCVFRLSAVAKHDTSRGILCCRGQLWWELIKLTKNSINSFTLKLTNVCLLYFQNLNGDKSKKTWTQRLKIIKTDKAAPTTPIESHPGFDEYPPNTMKYGKPTFYGTMRGYPPGLTSPNTHFFAPMHTVPVVLCSCPDYLNGTKKDTKKAAPAICKKCRGSRLSFRPIGGTVRIHSSTPMIQASRGSAGTVRLPSAYQQRPSILSAESDPYDMMRRSRLVSPDVQCVKAGFKSTSNGGRNRAKSSSPSRGRSRLRSPSPSAAHFGNAETTRSRSNNRKSDVWTNETEDELNVASGANRRSILHCDLNAYELISTISHNNEFAPMGADDIYSMHSSSFDRAPSATKECALDVTQLGGQCKPFASAKSLAATDQIDPYVYDHVDFAGDDLKTRNKQQVEKKSPIRPARAQRIKSDTTPSTPSADNTIALDTSPDKSTFLLTSIALTHLSNGLIKSTQPQIKSILKRPSSVSSDSQPSSLSGCELDGRTITVGQRHSEPCATKAPIAEPATKDKRISGSQFYLPMPQRKKVQFLVDNDIIYDREKTINATTESYFGENDHRHNEISVYTEPNADFNPSSAFDTITGTQHESANISATTPSSANSTREFCNYSLVTANEAISNDTTSSGNNSSLPSSNEVAPTMPIIVRLLATSGADSGGPERPRGHNNQFAATSTSCAATTVVVNRNSMVAPEQVFNANKPSAPDAAHADEKPHIDEGRFSIECKFGYFRLV